MNMNIFFALKIKKKITSFNLIFKKMINWITKRISHGSLLLMKNNSEHTWSSDLVGQIIFGKVLIYFDRKVKNIIISHMVEAMMIIGILVLGFQIEGIVLCILHPPIPYALFILAIIVLISVICCEAGKIYLLVDKFEKLSMVILIVWLLFTVYFTIMALAILIYLSQVQKNDQSLANSHLSAFLVMEGLTFNSISWANLVFYFGNALGLGFYTRGYYRMFWVNNIVHIYRYLRKKVHHMNEALLSNLPIIPMTDQLEESLCSLCLDGYQDVEEQLTKLPCQHIFHRNCIRLWVMRSNACPLCRKRVIFS